VSAGFHPNLTPSLSTSDSSSLPLPPPTAVRWLQAAHALSASVLRHTTLLPLCRQPELREMFGRVFGVPTASGNNGAQPIATASVGHLCHTPHVEQCMPALQTLRCGCAHCLARLAAPSQAGCVAS
jgi:hypothetical protein